MIIPCIMPCWINDEETLDLTISAIDTIKKDNVAMFLVDNGSTLGGGRLRDMADVYIRLKNNLGYAKAVNLGLKACFGSNAVIIANNDIRVSNNYLKVAEEILEDETVGSVHFRMIGYEEPMILGEDTWTTGKERWCSSSFFIMRLTQFYDDNFYNSCDDWSFWYEYRKSGWKTAYTNKACYQHKDSHSQKKIPEREENDKRNRAYYVAKYGKTPEEQFEEMFPGQLAMPFRPMP